MSDEARLEALQRDAAQVLQSLSQRDVTLRKAQEAGRDVETAVARNDLQSADLHHKLMRQRVEELVAAVLEARDGRFGDQLEAHELNRRAPARAGQNMGPGRLREKERQSERAEVIQLRAHEIFDLSGGKKLATLDVLEAMNEHGVNSRYLGEYLADLVKATKTKGSINQRREVIKLVFLFLQHIEPKALDLGEQDLDSLSTEEIEVYQKIAARMVARAHTGDLEDA